MNTKDKILSHLKRINGWFFLFSVLFSAMLTASLHIFNYGNDVQTVYVTDFQLLDLILFAAFLPTVYLLFKGAALLLRTAMPLLLGNKRKWNFFLLAGCTLFFMIMWVPYLMSFWPGGIYADTVDSLNMALGKAAWDNHNPVLYTLLWRVVFQMTGAFSGKGEYPGLKCFTVAQTLVLALVLACFITWCFQQGIHKYIVCLLVLLTALFPLYPFYGISLWKDTPFSLAVFVFSVFLYDTVQKERLSGIRLTLYGILLFLVIFLRNNGIYIAGLSAFGLILLYGKRALISCESSAIHKKNAVRITILSLSVLLVSLIIQGPVFEHKGYNIDRARESFGIPIQQTAYILAKEGDVSEEDRALLNEIMPLENWTALYNPTVVDTIKFDPSFHKDYLEEHSKEFLRTYLHLVGKNPRLALNAYLLATIGFWDIRESSSVAYICNFHFGNAEYFMSDYFDYYFDFSFAQMVEPRKYLSSALFVWLLLGTIAVCLTRKNYNGLAALLPTLAVWLTLMIATPVAYSFRYTYALFLCTPLYLLIAVQSYQKQK